MCSLDLSQGSVQSRYLEFSTYQTIKLKSDVMNSKESLIEKTADPDLVRLHHRTVPSGNSQYDGTGNGKSGLDDKTAAEAIGSRCWSHCWSKVNKVHSNGTSNRSPQH
mmetsp:Transcript_30207/g.42120  ORF Transcript_30207/g.42120 Transcript_30207/m.42120 type:complete len:108 (-) Transcript_30207:223-546(-)